MKKSLDTLTSLPSFVLLDKPLGISSFDVIRILHKHFGKQKIGHAGTLDPQATGLLLLGVGSGTKKITELVGLDKTYLTDIVLGKSTTTGDVEGKVVETLECPDMKERQVEDAVYGMKGALELPVSLYSAIKKNGKPLYKYAREGVLVETPFRTMEVKEVSLLDWYKKEPFQVARVRFRVSKGTYIRSLGEELGKRLSVPASLLTLRRTSVGVYTIEDSYTIPDEWLQDFMQHKKRKKEEG